MSESQAERAFRFEQDSDISASNLERQFSAFQQSIRSLQEQINALENRIQTLESA